MKNTQEVVKTTIKRYQLFKKTDYLVLMVSGGSDSVALAYIMNEVFPKKFAIMHLNHNLRSEAKEDAQFVKLLAKHLGVPYFGFSENVSKVASQNKENIEACGRELRYKYANEVASKFSGNVKICTAHTADDRIENFYMRSIIGTGPGGFAGINYTTNNVIRPLLDLPKEALSDYIKSYPNAFKDGNGNLWREDKTNEDTDRFRAYVRHEIIPLAKRQNPQILANLTNSMNLIADESDYIEEKVAELLIEHFEFNEQSFLIRPGFKNENIALKRRAIYNALLKLFPKGTRLEAKSIASILEASDKSNYTDNIQENYSVHSNKNGVLVQPMEEYRKSRNRI